MHLTQLLSVITQLDKPDYCHDCQVFVETNVVNNFWIRKWSEKTMETCEQLPGHYVEMCQSFAEAGFNTIKELIFSDHQRYCNTLEFCVDNKEPVDPIEPCDACVNMVDDIKFMISDDKDMYDKLVNDLADAFCQDQADSCHKNFAVLVAFAVNIIKDQTSQDICIEGLMCEAPESGNKLTFL